MGNPIEKFKNFNWNRYFREHWVITIISLFIGAASHLIWDSFTHEHGFFVEKIEFLAEGQLLFGQDITTFRFLQHGSTILGLSVIVFSLFKLDQVKITSESDIESKYWLTLTAIVFGIIAVRLALGLDYRFYGHLIVTGLSGLVIGLILTPVLIRKKKKTAG